MSDVRTRRKMAARLRRLAELREGQARRERSAARRELDEAQESLDELEQRHERAEQQLLSPNGPLTGAHMRLLQDGRLAHRDGRVAQQRAVAERSAEHDTRIRAHERAIGEQRGKEVLEDRMKRELREEFERQESRELDEISASRGAGSSDEPT